MYECRREKDGGFLLHLTLHQPTQQPLDTLYSLRLDPGRQTVVTLIFIREAFGYKEPLFPQEMLDRFLMQQLDAPPHQIILQKSLFISRCFWSFLLYYWRLSTARMRRRSAGQ